MIGKLMAVVACGALVSCASVQKEDADARVEFSSCAKPVYPAEALATKREGTVVTKFLVDTDGVVKESRIGRSSGHRDLDAAAEQGIKQCKFVPAVRNGKPVKEWATVQYVWTLK
jgi:bla regulator protein blaR1